MNFEQSHFDSSFILIEIVCYPVQNRYELNVEMQHFKSNLLRLRMHSNNYDRDTNAMNLFFDFRTYPIHLRMYSYSILTYFFQRFFKIILILKKFLPYFYMALLAVRLNHPNRQPFCLNVSASYRNPE